jgi:hypothetical protein
MKYPDAAAAADESAICSLIERRQLSRDAGALQQSAAQQWLE